MNTSNEQIRYKKVLGAKLLIESGLYDEIEKDIINALIEGKTTKARDFLAYFDLYTKEIQESKEEARKHASYSFYCALAAMAVGFAFIFWGACHIFQMTTWGHAAAGSAIATIGGSISAYIAKTFLWVHRLSLQQSNYYRQHSFIAHQILLAHLIADDFPDPIARQKVYTQIVSQLLSIIQRKYS